MTMSIDELLRTSGLVVKLAPDDRGAPNLRPTAFVHAGHMFCSATGHEVSIILGSCVAVCLWDPITGVGGVTHYLLPTPPDASRTGPRFGTYAIPCLIERLVHLGASEDRLLAKIFGGASVRKELEHREGGLGERNVELAKRLLFEARIPVHIEDVGGRSGRKVVFSTDNGTTIVRSLGT